jgi:dephospho-CoA kinase
MSDTESGRRSQASTGRKKPYVIVVSGSIGAGKTTVCLDLKKQPGVEAIFIDQIAHSILDNENPVSDRILARFGSDLRRVPTTLVDIKELRKRIFATDETRREYESMLHPEMFDCLRERITFVTEPFVIIELALVFEWGLEDIADEIWVITTEREAQIARLIKRYGYDRNSAIKDIELQWPQEKKAARATRILVNSGDREALIKQAIQCLELAKLEQLRKAG